MKIKHKQNLAICIFTFRFRFSKVVGSDYHNGIILSWYSRNKRALPWRQTRDAYRIWLSEVILQQTRISQGLPYYKKFINKFPTVIDLARANEQEVLLTWQGLGYYSRARNIHKCAQVIVKKYRGRFPDTVEELLQLPGIGPYTAGAIASISFGKPAPVLDGNVFRVLSRIFDIEENINTSKGKKIFEKIAMDLMPVKNPGDFNQAIMEFGALQCKPKNPKCEFCEMQSKCLSFERKNQHLRPVKLKKSQKRVRYFHYIVIENGHGIYLKKRDGNDIWKGLFDFFLIESNHNKNIGPELFQSHKLFRNYKLNEKHIRSYKHVLTHQVIYASFYRMRIKKHNGSTPTQLADYGKFYKLNEIEKLPKPVLVNKYLKEEIF